jgi:tRNA (mo5U34)-methyltransferase
VTSTPDPDRARRLIEQPGIVWHQRFLIAPGVDVPGVNDVGWIANLVGFPDDLTGKTVLDIGTTNGGVAFMAEARGAASVTATDIVSPSRFGFDQIADLLGSRVRFVESSVYELPEKLDGETFDFVIFWGVLYHLRHPLLGLDCVRRVAHGTTLIESAVCDDALQQFTAEPVVLCDADPAGIGDETNWFMPNTIALQRWVERAGFDIECVNSWPEPASRAHLRTRASKELPRYVHLSNAFERPMSVRVLDYQTSYPAR